jgi:hypothetical protein
MKTREIKQYGWIAGPVECRRTGCDWTANFIAVDSSIPLSIANAFAVHKCTDYAAFQCTINKPELGHDD